MSDRMVSCVRLFAFRKDISMNNKDRKRQIAYEVLMILGSLALLTFICRLWPILLLIILGIFVAAIRLLFLSGNRVDPVEPQPLLPAPISAPTESDLRKLAHSLITNRVTTLVLNEYPNARWIWEAPNAYAEFNGFDNDDKYRLMDISARGSNRDGAALRYVAEALSKRSETVKLLILVSDGQPADTGYYGTAAEEDLRGIKQEYQRKGILFVAAAIGNDKQNIERIYGDSFLDITDLNQLPTKLTGVVKRHIRV